MRETAMREEREAAEERVVEVERERALAAAARRTRRAMEEERERARLDMDRKATLMREKATLVGHMKAAAEAAAAEQEAAARAANLPLGWVATRDSDGRKLFVHAATHRKTFVKPTPLPDGWIAMLDDDDAVIFVNTATGERLETKPQELSDGWSEIDPTILAHLGKRSHAHTKLLEACGLVHEHPRYENMITGLTATARPPPLPQGWTMVVPTTAKGRAYYRNGSTGETRWKAPIATPAVKEIVKVTVAPDTSEY